MMTKMKGLVKQNLTRKAKHLTMLIKVGKRKD
jgi:hypothetical protein